MGEVTGLSENFADFLSCNLIDTNSSVAAGVNKQKQIVMPMQNNYLVGGDSNQYPSLNTSS